MKTPLGLLRDLRFYRKDGNLFLSFNGGSQETSPTRSIGPRKRLQPTRAPIRRGFDSAQGGRLTTDWVTQPTAINYELQKSLNRLKARSRDQSYNNDYFSRFIDMCQKGVIGPHGIMVKPAIVVDSNPNAQDEVANIAVKEAWDDWGQERFCDVARQKTWIEMQDLFISTLATDGEVLIRKHVGSDLNPYGFGLQFIDSVLLDVDLNKDFPDGRMIRLGVETDRLGKPLAYFFIDNRNGNSYFSNSRRHVRIPAEEIIHAFLHRYTAQARGIPWASTALFRMNMLDSYEDAALIAGRVGAAKMGFYEQASGGKWAGDEKDDQGEIIEEVEAGIFGKLPPGVTLSTFDPTYPHEQFPFFLKAITRGISSGLGVDYNTLANDLEGVTYSSIRSGKLDDWDMWMKIQEWTIGRLIRPVFREFVNMALLASKITTTNGSPLPYAKRDKFQKARYQGRRWPWVDPQKEISANREAVDGCLKSRSQVMRDQGHDPEEMFQEIADERATMKKLGLPIVEKAPEQKPGQGAGKEKDDGKEED